LKKKARVAAFASAALLGGGALALVRSTGWLASLGGRLSGGRLLRARRSPQWRGGRFENSVATRTIVPGGFRKMIAMQFAGDQVRRPRRPIPVERLARSDFEAPPASGLRVTWMGHASVLIEIGGLRVLTDPVWSERVSPSTAIGPKRFFDPPISLGELPRVDAVVISHDHYDHLDMATVRALAARGAEFFVPLGVGAHLEKWGVPPAQFRELDWGGESSLGGVRFLCVPSRHFSGRLPWENSTLWSSWVVAAPRHRVFFCGDSGFFDGFGDIGRAHGPFDVALVSSGAYSPQWPSIHMIPEEVVEASVEVKAQLLIPIHWGTFNLAFHAWNEPAERAFAEAARRGVPIRIPRPGERVELPQAGEAPRSRWWEPSSVAARAEGTGKDETLVPSLRISGHDSP
jgi:L-ascorbate metabolism protein UlaG (beta-lactamase superfamily)